MADIITEIGIWIAAFLTIAIMSVAYRDNPIFKFAEHTYLGAAVGYSFAVAIGNIRGYGLDYIYPVVKDPWYVIPLIIGVLMYFRYHRTLYWLFRYGMAVVVGTSVTSAFIRSIEADFLTQVRSTVSVSLTVSDATVILGNVIMVIAFITSLYYFIFTFPVLHSGSFGYIPRVGRWLMMVAFGYSFATTVVSRVDLMVGRLQFLLFDWLKIPK
ncbi:MAG: hypothetical protein QXI93_03240 [Candidatus Methanomethylicia archaeon]